MNGYRFLISRRWLGYYAIILIGVLACIALSIWQGERREQRLAEIARVEQNYDGPVVPIQEILASPTAPLAADDEWTRVELHGTWGEQILLARNRPLEQQAGFEVIVPFDLDDGSQLLVSRGWIGTSSQGGEPEAIPEPPAGEVTAIVRLRPAQDGSRDDNPAGMLRAIDPDRVDGLAQPYTEVYGQLADEEPQAAEELTPLPYPDISEGSHLSYQMQWLAFGVMFIWGGVYAARREARGRAEARDAAPVEYEVVDKEALAKGSRAHRPLPDQRRRRRDSADDLAEDALVDRMSSRG